LKLNDPEVVKNEYANESRFERRRAAFAHSTGPSALDTLFDAVAEVAPGRYLEVGCGPGDFAARVQQELGADVVGEMSFTREHVRDYVANSIGHAHLTESIAPFAEPLAVTRNMTIFVATK